MSYLITNSNTPLLMDTVPVLKIKEYYGEAGRDNVYSYMRCYAFEGELYCSFTSFDIDPPEGVKMALCLFSPDTNSGLVATASKHSGAQLYAHTSAGEDVLSDALQPQSVVTGVDEQGFYWSVSLTIKKQAFINTFGKELSSGELFFGNLFLYSEHESAFGCAFAVPAGESALTKKGDGTFLIVPY